MKIVTWNINSVRLRLDLLQKLSREQAPDIICLQETKVTDDLFPVDDIHNIGYEYLFYSGQKSYNGVAILSKIKTDDSFSLEFCNQDKRHVAIKIGDIELHNFYVPSGGDIPSITENPKFKHKLEYLAEMKNWFTKHRSKNDNLILVGDLNISPYEHDVWSSKQLRNDVSHTDIERSTLIDLHDSLHFVDSCRYFTPMNQKFYTWWSYRNVNWRKSNRGRRLDHIWVSQNLQDRMTSVQSLSNARDWIQPSDHVPYILEITI